MNQREKFEAWLRSIWTPGYDCRRGPGGDSYAHREAQNYWIAWQAALAASGGNAAPELTDERAAFEADTLDLYAAATFNRYPNSDRYNVAWVQDQWGGWQRRAKYAAASAPNAALVAALQDIAALYGTEENEWDGVERVIPEMVKLAKDALSAAGQEVGK